MRGGKRRVQILIGVVLGLVAAWGLEKYRPRERLLLQNAARIADEKYVNTWVSNDEILQANITWPVDAAHSPKLTRLNLRTRIKQSFVLKQCPPGTHTRIVPSPDGRWVFCADADGGRDNIIAVNLQTGRSLQWPLVDDLYHYPLLAMSDCRRWLSVGTLDQGYLTIYNVEKPGKSLHLPFPGYDPVRFGDDYFVTTSNHFFAVGGVGSGVNPFFSVPNGAYIREYRLTSRVERLRTFLIRLPIQGEKREMQFSPAGDRIAWMFEETRRPSRLIGWLHRFLHFIPVKPQERLSLWVTDTVGQHLREIGYVFKTEKDGYDVLERLQWLPDGKKLSFIYKNALYTVPAN